MTRADVRLWLQIMRLVPVVIILGGAAWHRWQKRRMEALAQGWPSVDGRLHDGSVEPGPGANRSVATFTYDYFIDEYRSGTYTHEFSSQKDAEEFVSQIKGKRVPIRYNPSKPDESIIEESDIEQLVPVGLRLS
jgi:hypothetical protein